MNNIDQLTEIVNENSSIKNELPSARKATGVIRVTVKLPARHPSGREWRFSHRITVIKTKRDHGFAHECDKKSNVTFGSKSDVGSCHTVSKGFEHDCEALSAMQLRKVYPHEASCHKNMLLRIKRNGAVVHNDFHDFRSFLKIVGPAPTRAHTLDRIDNANPMYGSGFVRWADKVTQNNNKGDSRKIIDATGEAYTPADVAAQQGVDAATIRQRLHRGWTDAEILAGERVKACLAKPSSTIAVKTPVQLIANNKSGNFIPPTGYKHTVQAVEESYEAREYRHMKEAYARARADQSIEPLLADYYGENGIRELGLEVGVIITEADYERHFKKHWPQHRPFLNYDKLKNESLFQWELIARIDPNYVAAWNRRKAEVSKYSELL